MCYSCIVAFNSTDFNSGNNFEIVLLCFACRYMIDNYGAWSGAWIRLSSASIKHTTAVPWPISGKNGTVYQVHMASFFFTCNSTAKRDKRFLGDIPLDTIWPLREWDPKPFNIEWHWIRVSCTMCCLDSRKVPRLRHALSGFYSRHWVNLWSHWIFKVPNEISAVFYCSKEERLAKEI